MIPNIFISSTVQDLSHLRDSIRDTIMEIGYNPIMSEYGDIGFLPSTSAEDSCYMALKDCHLAIMIIGKRYGSISKNGLSVTHNEFKTTRERKIPVIFLVSEEVMAFKKVFDLNENNDQLSFPGMDVPSKTFQLIKDFSEFEANNGLIPFSNVHSAKANLKKQLAHLFGDLLLKQFDPVKGEIKDILSEITTLRHILLKNEQDLARKFASAFRFLLNDENDYLKEIAEIVSDSLEEAVPKLLESGTFEQYLRKNNVIVEILDSAEASKRLNLFRESERVSDNLSKIFYGTLPYNSWKNQASFGGEPDYNVLPVNKDDFGIVIGIGKKLYITNVNGNNLMEAIFMNLKQQTQ